jgi:hypothetical protein
VSDDNDATCLWLSILCGPVSLRCDVNQHDVDPADLAITYGIQKIQRVNLKGLKKPCVDTPRINSSLSLARPVEVQTPVTEGLSQTAWLQESGYSMQYKPMRCGWSVVNIMAEKI